MVVRDSTTWASGGGIANVGGTATLMSSLITANHTGAQLVSSGNGGGLSNNGGTMTLIGTVVQANASFGNGDGILNANGGHLVIRDSSQVIGNNATAPGAYGGGIDNDTSSQLTIDGSIVANNLPSQGGGGIRSSGMLTVTNTSISGNTGFSGAGIYITGGTVAISSSTISANSSFSLGAALTTSGARTTLVNTTLSGNTVAAIKSNGIAGSTLTLVGVTVANNDSGIANSQDATTTLVDTLLANTHTNCAGTVQSGDYNLSSDMSCTALIKSHDLTNTNPLIGPLASNGGPTQTHALLGGSPAIDAGGTSANGCPATDQRGVSRPQGAACDIGAFEAYAPPPPAPRASNAQPPPVPPNPAPQPRGGAGSVGQTDGPTPNPLPPHR